MLSVIITVEPLLVPSNAFYLYSSSSPVNVSGMSFMCFAFLFVFLKRELQCKKMDVELFIIVLCHVMKWPSLMINDNLDLFLRKIYEIAFPSKNIKYYNMLCRYRRSRVTNRPTDSRTRHSSRSPAAASQSSSTSSSPSPHRKSTSSLAPHSPSHSPSSSKSYSPRYAVPLPCYKNSHRVLHVVIWCLFRFLLTLYYCFVFILNFMLKSFYLSIHFFSPEHLYFA